MSCTRYFNRLEYSIVGLQRYDILKSVARIKKGKLKDVIWSFHNPATLNKKTSKNCSFK